jgi:hypothetical protein
MTAPGQRVDAAPMAASQPQRDAHAVYCAAADREGLWLAA